ncbi:TPA: hypothetical protein DEP34_00090 [Candidatus Uhrbacteria bacterium]|nr:hypothetical protein [Candidatus Uhrbacteria bacterium]HCB18772.1 hypothetical protein [Candidatus Uhrbacteria bacterium]
MGKTNQKTRGLGFLILLPKFIPKIFGFLFKFLKMAKGFKIGMAVATFGSYTWLFSWQFALLLMGSIFFHELGHIRAMKAYGMKTKGVYFLPFLGAAAVTEDQFSSRHTEAVIGLWGPVWGLILSMIFFDIYAWTGSPLMAGIAGWCALVNLFNLLPIKPLDGGRIVSSIAFSFSRRTGMTVMLAGLSLAFILAIVTKISIFPLIVFIGFLEVLSEWRDIPDVRGLRESLREKVKTVIGCDPDAPKNEILKRMFESNISETFSNFPLETREHIREIVGSEKLTLENFVQLKYTEDVSGALLHVVYTQVELKMLTLLLEANVRKRWRFFRMFHCDPKLLRDTVLQSSFAEAFFGILNGTFELSQKTSRPLMDTKSIVVTIAGTMIVIALLISIIYLSAIDPGSMVALRILQS